MGHTAAPGTGTMNVVVAGNSTITPGAAGNYANNIVIGAGATPVQAGTGGGG